MAGGERRQVPRMWGFWTKQKLSILADYLVAFGRAAQSARRTLYLDLFAGQDRNLSRETGEPISGSPRVALGAQPPFTKLVFFELPNKADGLRRELLSSYGGRDFEVVPGDCNEEVVPVLRRLTAEGWDFAPTFAFLDQHAAEIRWSTLEALAAFKRPEKTKAELWFLFAPSMLPRGLASKDDGARQRFAHRVTDMYGTDEWEIAYRDRRAGTLSPERLRDELLNLMRWRIEKILGYKATHSFGLRSATGTPLYEMIFATDHDAGERIMSHLYRKAVVEQPQMRADALARLEEERDIKQGRIGLFDAIPRQFDPPPPYRHEPPQPPYWLPTSGQSR